MRVCWISAGVSSFVAGYLDLIGSSDIFYDCCPDVVLPFV